MRRRCHSGRHGRRRVAGRSLSALISLRNGWRGERDVALRRAARCSAAVCLLLADCSPVVLCHPQVGRPRRLQRGSETQGLLLRSFGSETGVPRPISARRSCRCARGGCRCSVVLLTLDACRVVVFLACGFNHTPTGLFLVIPGVLEVGRRCRDGGRGRCARRKVDGEGEEEARASPSRRSAK